MYCTEVLHFPEHAAYGRIEAARAAWRFPLVLERLADGSITLTTVCLLGPHQTETNHRQLLDSARYKSKRDVERQVAALQPKPPVPPTIRKLPERMSTAPRSSAPAPSSEPSTPSESAAPATSAPVSRPAVVAPLSGETYKIQFTISRDTYEKLRRSQDLLRHRIPNGDLFLIFDRALTVLLADIEREKAAVTSRPRGSRTAASSSRRIPAAVRRDGWARDAGRCAFVGAQGRCTETGFLEFHHMEPYALGGTPVARNIQLRCAAHNVYEATLCFEPQRFPVLRERRAAYG